MDKNNFTLSKESKSLFEKGYELIPVISNKYIKGDSSELQGYLVEKLIHIFSNNLDTTQPYYTQWKYISTSLNGYTKNYFRDESRSVRLPRPIHDRYHSIISYKKKYEILNPTKEQICTALSIGTLEYDEAMEQYGQGVIPIDIFNGNISDDQYSDSCEEYSLISCLSSSDREAIENNWYDCVSDEGIETLSLLGVNI